MRANGRDVTRRRIGIDIDIVRIQNEPHLERASERDGARWQKEMAGCTCLLANWFALAPSHSRSPIAPSRLRLCTPKKDREAARKRESGRWGFCLALLHAQQLVYFFTHWGIRLPSRSLAQRGCCCCRRAFLCVFVYVTEIPMKSEEAKPTAGCPAE